MLEEKEIILIKVGIRSRIDLESVKVIRRAQANVEESTNGLKRKRNTLKEVNESIVP